MPSADLTRDVALDRDLGAHVVDDGVSFTVWAPRQTSVAVVLDGGVEHEMERHAEGYFRLHLAGVGAGQRYRFKLAEGLRADPASGFQPEGVFGPSMVDDPATFAWTDRRWPGAVPAHRQVIYEMHLGTFTTAGTWAAAQERLSSLASLGITTIEVMPIAEFTGRFGWGYDGVLLFAPFHHYGTPDDVRRFVDAAHAAGLAVILDVVYNHIGPVGSVLQDYSDTYFSSHESDWGTGFNLDGDQSAHVRRFINANVRHWLDDYHFDGLRFDAVHAIVDRSPQHILDEVTQRSRDRCAPKRLYMVAENEAQRVSMLMSEQTGTQGMDGIWNEDWHHTAFVTLTGMRESYFTDYFGTAAEFAAMAKWNLLYQGQWYSWQKQGRGSDARHIPGSAFVCFLENHDQVANTGVGGRLYHSADQGLWRALIGLLLLGPGAPMLFQGQERAVPEPFTYFADHEGELATAVQKGREEFLAQFPTLCDPAVRRLTPRPVDEDAFRKCQITWQDGRDGERAWQLHVDLLTLRRTDPVISLAGTPDVTIASSAPTPTILIVRYQRGDDERLILLNLGPLATLRMNDPLLAPPHGQTWSLMWCSEHIHYGGRGIAETFVEGPWTLQAHCAWLLKNVPVDSPPV